MDVETNTFHTVEGRHKQKGLEENRKAPHAVWGVKSGDGSPE